MRRVILALLTVAAIATSAEARTNVRRYRIFGGGNTDSTEQASQWFPVEGASRVYIRLYTTHATFGGNADSTFSDSITTFKVLMSDSLSNRVSTLSGFATNLPTTGASGGTTGGATDSLLEDFSTTAAPGINDTLISMHPSPINKQLRGPTNGWGLIIAINPTGNNVGGTIVNDPEGVIPKKMMRIRITPLRRATAQTGSATVPSRVVGLKGLYGEAIVVVRE